MTDQNATMMPELPPLSAPVCLGRAQLTIWFDERTEQLRTALAERDSAIRELSTTARDCGRLEEDNRRMREQAYPMLLEGFLQAMNDIGAYGHAKYGADSFQHRAKAGDRTRWMSRVDSAEIAAHAGHHFDMFLAGTPHDHFGTRLHQLAAAAFNCMMEAYLSGALAPAESEAAGA